MTDSELYALKRRVLDLERRLSLLDGGAPVPSEVTDEELQRHVLDGETMLAIKRYRELTDTSLSEAKAVVEAMMRG